MKSLYTLFTLLNITLLSACSGTLPYMSDKAGDLDDGQTHDEQVYQLPIEEPAPLPQAVDTSSDTTYYTQALNKAYMVDLNQQTVWTNPETESHGVITPTREGYSKKGEYCREFESKQTIRGAVKVTYITACQNINGVWHVAP